MAVPYIQVQNIAKSFGDQIMYENLSLTINEGERVALLAKNGAGKSTLLNIIAGAESADKGEVIFRNGVSLGYLLQEPLLPDDKSILEAIYHSDSVVAKVIREYEKALLDGNQEVLSSLLEQMDSCGGWAFEHRAKDILTKLKITDLNQNVGTLSGGQRKRLALAIVLIDNPDVIILDEPTNHLDLEMAEWLEEYLQKSNKTIFMVTHDRYFLDRITTNIYEIDQKQIYSYKGGYSDYLLRRSERIEQFNTEVEKAQNLFRKEAEWMRRMPQARGTKAKYRKDAFYEIKDKAFQKRNDDQVEISVKATRLGTKIFEAKDICKRFDDKILLKDFSYIFSRYEKLGIIGKNGTGKSTFLNILTSVIAPDSGIVDVGESVRFGYYKQQADLFDNNKKVIDIAQDITEVVSLGDGSTISVSQFLTHFLFTPEVQYNYVSYLSGGERRRLYLLTILMQNPNFLILDEPTNDLDIMTLNILEDYLESFGGCLIVVSHDRYFMDKVVDKLLVFEGEGVIRNFPGNYTEYRNKQLEETDNKEIVAPEPKVQRDRQQRERKLSFKEKQELQILENQIEDLENQKRIIEAELSSGTLQSEELTTKSITHAEIENSLDEKSMRWLELSEIEE